MTSWYRRMPQEPLKAIWDPLIEDYSIECPECGQQIWLRFQPGADPGLGKFHAHMWAEHREDKSE